MTRPRQTNCQQEPPYPAHRTVIFSIRYPDLTCHDPNELCAIQEPHATSECGEWTPMSDPMEPTAEAMERVAAELEERERKLRLSVPVDFRVAYTRAAALVRADAQRIRARPHYSGHHVVKVAREHGWRKERDYWLHPEHGRMMTENGQRRRWRHTRTDGTPGAMFDALIDAVLAFARTPADPESAE